MAYSNSTDVQNAAGGARTLTQLLDRDANGTADTGVLDAAIEEADALIDSYASKRFAVPFETPSTQVAKLSARLAVYFLRRGRSVLTQADLASYESDEKWLKMLADGDVLPGVEPIPTKGQIVRDAATSRSSLKDVSRAKLKGYT
jgi:phage gp36-like protein